MYAGGNPVNRIDPTGLYLESAWDLASLAMGVACLANDIANDASAADIALDVGGIIVDTAALLLPVPGGAGAAIKAGKVAKTAKTVRAADAALTVVESGKAVAEGVAEGDYVKAGIGAAFGAVGAGQFKGGKLSKAAGGKKAAKTATKAKPEKMVTVSRWGKQGPLEPGDWVMKGKATRSNYIRSFKWQPESLPGKNKFAPFKSGQEHIVPKSQVGWPHEQGWYLDWMKAIWGQRKIKTK